MSVIIRLQNLPWSANALDIRSFFRGLSIPEGGVHIVGGELGDAFIAFSTDEDARQAMMHDGGKLKEIQVKLFLSSRSEMHKVIETARNTVPLLSIPATPAPAPVPVPVQPQPPAPLGPFATALGNAHLLGFGVPSIPGLGNPHEIPQPAVIEPPPPVIAQPPSVSPEENASISLDDKRDQKRDSKDRRRSRSRSREKKDRFRGRRDRSRSRERRRRDRSRSRERRDRKRDRKDRSRSRERSPRRFRDHRNDERVNGNERDEPPVLNNKSVPGYMMRQENGPVSAPAFSPQPSHGHFGANGRAPFSASSNLVGSEKPRVDPDVMDTLNRLQELENKRNPHAFQGDVVGNGYPRGRGGGRGSRREGRPTRFEEDDLGDRCVALKNAPNFTSYGDVRRFFPYLIDKDGIKMINSPIGRRTGTIYVRFCDRRSKLLALQDGNKDLKGSMVKVEPLSDEAFEAAIDSYLPCFADDAPPPERLDPYTTLKLTDLPVFVQEHDIVKCFADFSLLSISLDMCRNTRSKNALVQFAKPDDAREAFRRRDSYLFGRRKPAVAIADESEVLAAQQADVQQEPDAYPAPEPPAPLLPEPPRDPRTRRAAPAHPAPGEPLMPTPTPQFLAAQFPGGFPPAGPRFPGALPFPFLPAAGPDPGPDPAAAHPPWAGHGLDHDDGPADCALVKGLPPDASDRTIVEFLSGARVTPSRVHIMLDTEGAPTGDCFCEFRDPEEATRAASCHGRELAGRRITVDLVTRTLMEEALNGPREPRRAPHGPPGPLGGPHGGPPGGPRGGLHGGPHGGLHGGPLGGPHGGPHGDLHEGPHGGGSWHERDRFEGRGRGFGRGSGRGSRSFGRGRGPRGGRGGGGARFDRRLEEPDVEDFGAPGCVVSMENVPFRASVSDILDFFGDFELSQDDIIRRFNERGQPTGDARVAFRTPFDAQRAVTTRHLAPIHERRISLCIM